MTTTITWLGHSTVILDVDDVRLIADPLLRRHAGILRRRGQQPRAALWCGADAVLLSHLHHDHAELKSLRMLPASAPVITGAANVRWLRRRKLAGAAPPEGEWIAVGSHGSVRVTLCRARHSGRPMPHRPNAANGHLVRGTASTIWLAGDTELFDGMTSLSDLAGQPIDLAVVPVSGWGPRLSRGHMGPAQAAEACLRVGARYAVPVHWGTLHLPYGANHPRGWMDSPGQAFSQALEVVAPRCTPLVLERGVPTSLE